jgi:hypothetical protein
VLLWATLALHQTFNLLLLFILLQVSPIKLSFFLFMLSEIHLGLTELWRVLTWLQHKQIRGRNCRDLFYIRRSYHWLCISHTSSRQLYGELGITWQKRVMTISVWRSWGCGVA